MADREWEREKTCSTKRAVNNFEPEDSKRMWLFILILRDERPGAGWRNSFSNNRKRITEDQGDPPSSNKTPDFAFQEAKEPKEVKMSQRHEENTGNRLLEKFVPMCAGYLEHHSVQSWKTGNFLDLSITEELAGSREHCHISSKTQELTRISSTHRCLQGWSLKAPLGQQKRHWCIEQSFGLCGRGRGWDDLGEWHWNKYNIIYETSRQSRFDARYWMLGASALGRPRGMEWGGRREEGSGWGTHVYLWQIHFDI